MVSTTVEILSTSKGLSVYVSNTKSTTVEILSTSKGLDVLLKNLKSTTVEILSTSKGNFQEVKWFLIYNSRNS